MEIILFIAVILANVFQPPLEQQQEPTPVAAPEILLSPGERTCVCITCRKEKSPN